MNAFEEIAHLADVRMHVDVELDRKMMVVRDILALEKGTVISMSRSARTSIS